MCGSVRQTERGGEWKVEHGTKTECGPKEEVTGSRRAGERRKGPMGSEGRNRKASAAGAGGGGTPKQGDGIWR